MSEAIVKVPSPPENLIEEGELAFSIESRLIRELGERLVREPEVALLELVKNSYDADSRTCEIRLQGNDAILIRDDGHGMTLAEFRNGWMRIGTGTKGKNPASRRFGRPITGEKGIGRFAVRYLGYRLELTSVAYDPARGKKTRLTAQFDWREFDRQEDLGRVTVPYQLAGVDDAAATGTSLLISELRPVVDDIDWKALRTGSMGVVSPIRSLLENPSGDDDEDPGFALVSNEGDQDIDIAMRLLNHYFLRSKVLFEDDRLELRVFRQGQEEPYLVIKEEMNSLLGRLSADIRFFPRREGLFADAGFDGRKAYGWVRDNHGVKVFDRAFQVRPYGMEGDDWLDLAKDNATNHRKPRSQVMTRHYPMTKEVEGAPKLNWMLRLPANLQLIGVVQVSGMRESDGREEGLIAAADREGFLVNAASEQLYQIVRTAVEAIAFADREITLREADQRAEEELKHLRAETRAAIAQIDADQTLSKEHRNRLIEVLSDAQERTERQQAGSREKEQQLEIMSLLGVVAGFMTHEFGVALAELREARKELLALAKDDPRFARNAEALEGHIETLRSFVQYSRAYVEGTRSPSDKPYKAAPRFRHVAETFGKYASKRHIEVVVDVEADVIAARVPPSLYDGIAQNLYSNALKALSRSRTKDRRIVFRAWNEGGRHTMQVSDTGEGIPEPIRPLVFDPLFTTTDRRNPDPLGSGIGLGLALVRRGAAAFGGKADLVDPPPGFSTCVEVQLPGVTDDE